MFNISKGIKKIGSIFHKLSSNRYASVSNNHIDYSGLQGCLFSSKKQLDEKWHSGYKSANSEFIWESFNNKLYPSPIFKYVIENKLTSKTFSVAKEINILNTVLINNYGVLDISRKSVEAEFDRYRESGFNFSKQRAKIIENKNIQIQLIESTNLIEQKKGVVSNKYELEVGSNVSSSSLIERMKKLSIAGYLSNYAGDDNLRQSVEEVIIKKASCIDEIKSMFGINNGLSCENYDESELVTLVGIDAM